MTKRERVSLTLCDPMGCTVHGILQARILEWVAFPFSGGSSQPGDRTQVSHITGGFFTGWATGKSKVYKIFVKQCCFRLNWITALLLLPSIIHTFPRLHHEYVSPPFDFGLAVWLPFTMGLWAEVIWQCQAWILAGYMLCLFSFTLMPML